jgi:pimeloyl-ACP methyl ester carboxylesterase
LAASATEPVALHYEEWGGGPAVLILHGLFGSSSNWRSFSKRLARDARVLAVDLRNHGSSPRATVHDYPSMAADVVALLDHLAHPCASVVGHSMGGKTAMEVAIRHPLRVDRLAVLDIAPDASADGVRGVLDVLLAVDLSAARSREDVDAALARHLSDPALRAFLLMGLARREAGAFGWKYDIDAFARNWDALGAPVAQGRYEGPTLFLRGELSDHIRDADVPAILARFPRARIETIAGAGHWLHAEAPDATLRVVREFLSEPLR